MSPARTVPRRPAAGTRRRAPAPNRNRRRPARRRPARRRSGKLTRLRRKLRPATLWPPVLLILVGLLGLAWDAGDHASAAPNPTPTDRCTLPSGVELTAEQVGNARVIAQVAHDRGLPDRAVVIALATAMQESRLRNLDYGDRDSLGLFQQRPSQGWGTPEQVQDPAYAAGKFYDHLVQIPNWENGDLSLTADAVQRSAFPGAYAKHEPMATELTAAMAQGELSCG